MHVEDLIWDDQNSAHIARHGIEIDEVEEIAFGRHHARRVRGENRYQVIGQTAEGRYLLIILDHEGHGVSYVVTAREMDSDERRQYHRAIHKR